ncbi:hypothetical protein LTV02_39045 [Nocardia yamanashiensis]|uniref:hypothetical protein n=1 Tax=Nocardia yamanashiensis TaxID=209247 RepID=UPI001E52BA9B|nr:hypothetical protein [Nocardia yamanashiensis]UGT41832.1 hypothetical protein LTV02_39045 [Nocardia yamanashiensis]
MGDELAFNTTKMRELATGTRTKATAIDDMEPVAVANCAAARKAMPNSAFATRIEESVQALDRVLTLHAARLRAFADKTDAAATAVDAMEEVNVESFKGLK